MVPGFYTTKLCNILNIRRKYNAAHHNTPSQKKRRKVIRGEKKKIDKQVLSEGTAYAAGVFRFSVVTCTSVISLAKQLG